MAKPYSSDLRERVVRAVVDDGLSRRAAAQRFGIGVSTVITWVQRWRETGRIEPGQMGGRRPEKIAGAWRTLAGGPLPRSCLHAAWSGR
jgi:putative transposase